MFTKILSQPIAVLIIILLVIGSYAGTFGFAYFKGAKVGEDKANKEWQDKMVTLVSKNNAKLQGIEDFQAEKAREMGTQIDSAVDRISRVVLSIGGKKAKEQDVLVYNERGEVLRCTNASGPVRLGNDFSESWNTLNNATKIK